MLLGEGLRLVAAISMLCLIAVAFACGGGGGDPGATIGPLTGNWEITLQRHAVPAPLTYTGFLVQNGSSVTGSVILGDGCSGVGPVSGTLDGTNLTLNIGEFGQDVSLIGTAPFGSAPMGGQFSTIVGACTMPYTSTGTWSGVIVPPLNGVFTGTFTPSLPEIPPINVQGTLAQGPNVGGSTTTLSGTISATNPTSSFCTYLTTATITGVISGETATLNLFDPDGSLISQMDLSITPKGSSLSGSSLNGPYVFQTTSKNCNGESGTLTLTFQ